MAGGRKVHGRAVGGNGGHGPYPGSRRGGGACRFAGRDTGQVFGLGVVGVELGVVYSRIAGGELAFADEEDPGAVFGGADVDGGMTGCFGARFGLGDFDGGAAGAQEELGSVEG